MCFVPRWRLFAHIESNLVWKVGNLESKECIICLQMTTGIKWPIFLGLSAIPQSSLKLFFPMLWADPAIHQDLWAINKTIHENLLCSVVYLRQGKCKYFSITWLCRFLFATLKYQHIKKKYFGAVSLITHGNGYYSIYLVKYLK